MKKYKTIDKSLLTLSCIFLLGPILLLLLFWFKWYISFSSIILLLFSTVFVLKNIKPLKEEEYKNIFNLKKIIIISVLIILLNILSGAGGLFHQNWDYHFRNAVFHDLIEKEWPVKYDYSSLPYEREKIGDKGILSYYFAFWLPSAAVGKLTDNFYIASYCLLVYQIVGSLLFFYLVSRYFKNTKLRYFFIFLAFSGLNTIGQFLMNIVYDIDIELIGTAHIDTSMVSFCMSSFVTQLFWVFNQSVPAWIATMFLFQEKDYKTCGYFFALLLPFAPFPMLGYLYIAFSFIIFGKELDKKITLERIKELLTFRNIAAVLAIVPIAFMFLQSNIKKGFVFLDAYNNGTLTNSLINYILYLILEFGIYIIIANKKNYKHIIMYFIFFAVVPLFYIGGADLGNRSTIPLLVGLYLLIVETLDTTILKKIKQKEVVLILVLAIAFLTNFNEIYRSIRFTIKNHEINIENFSDNYKTYGHFEGMESEPFISNFVSTYDKDDFYFKYFIK